MKTIGIIGAMPSELHDIRLALPNSEIVKKAGYEYYVNKISDNVTVVHACSGIAKVNAALCAQIMIDAFQPAAIINAGVAGGMNPEIKVCDMVLATEVLYHDLDLHFLKDYPPYHGIYECDKDLMEQAEQLCETFGFKSFRGRIVSGEAFVTDSKVKAQIQENFHPDAVDMESAAVGHTAWRNGTPFISIRCISDNADDEGAMSFDQFEKIAAKRVADLVLKLCETL